MLRIRSGGNVVRRALVLTLALTGVSGLSLAGAAEEGGGHVQPVGSTSAAAGGDEAAAGGEDQNIRVHGHWTITVLDPDGSVVERREFDNSLLSAGAQKLTQLLGREQSVGHWSLYAGSQGGLEVCENPVGTPTSICFIDEATDPTFGNNRFKTLTLTVASGAPFSLTLSGSLIAQRSGTINGVDTAVLGCTSATTPDDCATGLNPVGASIQVTSSNVSPVVPVVLGQQVVISVEISFS